MKTLIKTSIATAAISGMILGGMVLPATASASPQSYVCQAEKSSDAKTGTVIGALLGGVVGNAAAKNERGLGTVGGAILGGVIGNKLGKDHGKSTCNKIDEQARAEYGYDNGYGDRDTYSARDSYSYSYVYNHHTHRYERVRVYEPVRYDRYGYR